MSVESATYINQLSASNPTSSDLKSEGDNHIRLLKSTIQASFPNVTGAMTATHTELNYSVGVTSLIQTQLDAKLSKSGGTMTGHITLPSGGTGSNAATVTQVEALIASAESINLPATTGHDGDVLSSVAGVPTWVEGGLFLLATYDAAGASTVDIEALSSSYDDYIVMFSNVVTSAATGFLARVKKSGAYVTGSTYNRLAGTFSAGVTNLPVSQSATAGAVISGSITLSRVNSTTGQKIDAQAFGLSGSAGWDETMTGTETTAATITGIRFYVSSGTFTSGTFRLYGVAK